MALLFIFFLVTISAFVTCILIMWTNRIWLSCLATIIIVDGSIMLYSYSTQGAISQFGMLGYYISIPILLTGNLIGSIVWLRYYRKNN